MPGIRLGSFLPLFVVLLMPSLLHGGQEIGALQMLSIQKKQWLITGQVKSIRGEPVSNAKVMVRLASVTQPTNAWVADSQGKFGVIGDLQSKANRMLTVGDNVLMADVQGKYSVIVELEAQTNQTLTVEVSAEKEGFATAHETANFTKIGETWPIDLVMRSAQEDSSELSPDQLIALLMPRYGLANLPERLPEHARQDFARGIKQFTEQQPAAKLLASFSAAAKKSPECVECLTALGLVQLKAGGIASAKEDFSEAYLVKGKPADEPRKENALIGLGVLAEWSGEPAKAAGLLMNALKLAPEDPVALQEMGRMLVVQKNWDAADEYLQKAEKAGASPEAHLLRCRAVLEAGDPQEAEGEMHTYLAGREVKSLPLPVRALFMQVEAQMSLSGYKQASALIKKPLPELIKDDPDLADLQPASDQSQLESLLQKAGANVDNFFKQFQNATSREQIREEQLNKGGKVTHTLEQQFQYLLLTQPAQNGLMSLDEYRTDRAGNLTGPIGLKDGFMLSAGFASVSLFFHPAYQSGSDFRYLGRAKVNGTVCDVLGFAQVPARAKMFERFNTPGSTVLVLHQGIAWIDPSDSRIVRLRTDLLQPLPKVRLLRETTEIHYSMVRFKGVEAPISLPEEVAVTVEWKGRTFRNMHQYGDFKLFNTAIREKHDIPQVPAENSPTPN
jgi:Flp pilus assembly protein TadD